MRRNRLINLYEAYSERLLKNTFLPNIQKKFPYLLGTCLVLCKYGMDCVLKEKEKDVHNFVDLYNEIAKSSKNSTDIHIALRNKLESEETYKGILDEAYQLLYDFIENGLSFYRRWRGDDYVQQKIADVALYLFADKETLSNQYFYNSKKFKKGENINNFIPYTIQIYFEKKEQIIGEDLKFANAKPLKKLDDYKVYTVYINNVDRDIPSSKDSKIVFQSVTGVTDEHENIQWLVWSKDTLPAYYKHNAVVHIVGKYMNDEKYPNEVYFQKAKEDNPDFDFDKYYSYPALEYFDGEMRMTVTIMDVSEYTHSGGNVHYDVFGLTKDKRRVWWTIYDGKIEYEIGDTLYISAQMENKEFKLTDIVILNDKQAYGNDVDLKTRPQNGPSKKTGYFKKHIFRIHSIDPKGENYFTVLDDDDTLYYVSNNAYRYNPATRQNEWAGHKWDLQEVQNYEKVMLSGHIDEWRRDDGVTRRYIKNVKVTNTRFLDHR